VPKVKKENSKVECPDCGKRMSAKTLKYSHVPNCLFKKQADKEEALLKETSLRSPVDEGKRALILSDEVIEAEVQKRMSSARAERLNRRQKQLERLVANALP